jgi:GTP-binding protein
VGLGHEFLAHLERCQLILHMVDATGYYGADPLAGFRTILGELDAHGEGLGLRPQVVLLNKIDAVDPRVVEELVSLFRDEVKRLRAADHPAFSYLLDGDEPAAGQLVWPISAASGAGLVAFLRWVGPLLRELTEGLEPVTIDAADRSAPEAVLVREVGTHGLYRPQAGAKVFLVEKTEEGFAVRGRAVRRLVSRFDLTNDEAVRYLGERLDRLGVYAALRAKGAVPGDDVDIEGYAFEFQ